MISAKFAPVESKGVTYRAYSSAVMSLLTTQKVRVPMLIQPESVESALEVMQLVLELFSFILIDPVMLGELP